MPSIVVVGMQWGDEGKGKVIDLLSELARHIVRAQGGNNAGHTIVANGQEYRFHLVPSGIVYPHTQCYIGGGTVIDPASLWSELITLKRQKIAFEERLWISRYAHVVMPYHRVFDQLMEQDRGKAAIGTTGRGIGPCYVDKARRCGIRIADLLSPTHFRVKLEDALVLKNRELKDLYGQEPLELEPIFQEYLKWADHLRPFIAPIEERIYSFAKGGEKILFEGAQGALLDTTFGTYPFVTSSCTLSGGICSGAGVGPSLIGQTIGVAKAYTTRVGNGPLPTELTEQELSFFPDHANARELGTTTGRKRRIGWLDTFLLRHTIALNGVDALAVTKLDILDALDEIKICTGYKRFSAFPATLEEFQSVEPIYETHPGWKCSTQGIQSYSDLPLHARGYLKRIAELCNVPISIVSVGPDREKTLWLDRFFE